jgi:hypothetical protein
MDVLAVDWRSWALRSQPTALVIGLTVSVYYLVCVSLNERRVRYRGGGVADAQEQPAIVMLMFTSLAALLLGCMLLLVIRGETPTVTIK